MDELDAILNKKVEPLTYSEMSDAYAEPMQEEKTYGGDEEGLKKAAAEVDARRQEEAPVVERKYIDVQTGKDMPPNQTISLERAAPPCWNRFSPSFVIEWASEVAWPARPPAQR